MIRKTLKSLVPAPIWNRLGDLRRRWVTRDDDRLSAKEVFTRIYEKRIWTGEEELSSGAGSRIGTIVDPYVSAVKAWAETHGGGNLTALDFGCGDFHVGQKIQPFFGRYIGVDIVPILIESHRKHFQDPNLEFHCVDGIDEDLPEADVIFIRQVLQHLSNEQILKIVSKLKHFKHAIISEHLPIPSKLTARNLNKIHGGGIRLAAGSGIYLEDSPFSLEPLSSTVLLEVPHGPDPERDGVVVTTHYVLK